MKKQILLFAGLLLLAGLAAVPASAQEDVRAQIPFTFDVSGKTLPAGQYKYKTVAGSSQLLIEDARGWTIATVLTNGVVPQRDRNDSSVVFHCYSNRCFLARVWGPAQHGGREVLASKAETRAKEAAQQGEALPGNQAVEQITAK